MEEQGLDVELLLLLDTYRPGQSVQSRSVKELMRAMGARLSPLAFHARLKWFARLLQIKARVRSSMIRHRINTWLRRLGVQKPNPGEETVSRVADAALRAVRQYRPGIFHGRVVLFQAEYWDFAYFFRTRPELAGWGDLFKGEVQRVTIPGPHEFVPAKPCLSLLAEKMSTCHEEAARPEESQDKVPKTESPAARLSFSGKPG